MTHDDDDREYRLAYGLFMPHRESDLLTMQEALTLQRAFEGVCPGGVSVIRKSD